MFVGLLSVWPAPTLLHVPDALHTLQALLQADSQQTVSTQYPLKHSEGPLHVVPSTFLHTPLPSHSFDPVQMFAGLLSGCPAETLPQVPAALHTLQALLQADSQHTPSAQCPLKQGPSLLHG